MEDWLTIKEAAEMLKLSEHTVRDQVRLGKIPATKLGHRTVRVRRADIEALLLREKGGVWGPPVKLRKLSRTELGSWLLEVVEGEESPEEKLAVIRMLAYGLISG
ncbi:helix-turn-helix domain-containing protein [Armatimonas sp.]|uniref:helix-turn-helix domain-containing protein n=1 Tax=Armatimonas sp. TaxID=1872638 RepID=UPI003753C500